MITQMLKTRPQKGNETMAMKTVLNAANTKKQLTLALIAVSRLDESASISMTIVCFSFSTLSIANDHVQKLQKQIQLHVHI